MDFMTLAAERYSVRKFNNKKLEKEVIDKIRPFLITDGGNIEFIKYEDKISNEFNSLLTDGVLKIKTLKPKTMDEDNYFLYDYFYSMENENMSIGNIGCDENYTKCDIYIYIGDKREMHTVNVEFEKENSAVKTKLDSYIKKIDSLKVDDGTGWKTYTFDLIERLFLWESCQRKLTERA